MRKSNYTLILLIILSFLLTGCGYNKLQELEEKVFSAWGNVESNLQRRADLVPNLVAVAKEAVRHERETLQAVVEARAKATSVNLSTKDLGNAEAMAQFQQTQSAFSSALSRLMVVVERYPNLKANQNLLSLQDQLEGVENRINVARQRYNQAVAAFNTSVRKFPHNLTNKYLLNLDRKESFKAEEGAKTVPKVKFD